MSLILLPFLGLKRIIKKLNECDLIIINGIFISLSCYLKPTLCVLLTGSDLQIISRSDRVTSWGIKIFRKKFGIIGLLLQPVIKILLHQLSQRQQKGIKKAKMIVFPPEGSFPEDDMYLNSLGVSSLRRPLYWIRNNYFNNSRIIQQKGKLSIIVGARLNWKTPLPEGYGTFDLKGIDIFINGFARFVNCNQDANVELILIKKGLHINETVKLIEELGITHKVSWFNELSQNEYYEKCMESDVIVDSLGPSIPSLVTITGMACSKPVITNIPNIPIYKSWFEGAVCDVKTEHDVEQAINRLYYDLDYRVEMGERAYERALNKFHPRVAVEEIINQCTSKA